MTYFVGLDVSLETTSICVINSAGDTTREGQVETSPRAIRAFLKGLSLRNGRIGIEACGFADWLCPALTKMRLPVICIEARHAHNILKSNINKTDANDARGIAAIMRMGAYRSVHLKSLDNRILRTLITARRALQFKGVDIENAIVGLLRPLGLKIRNMRGRTFEAQVRAAIGDDDQLRSLFEPLLVVRACVREQFERLDQRLRAVTAADPVCRRLMTAPGVGVLVAATYRTVIDDPGRFQHSRTVGAYVGLTPRTSQSGERDSRGRVSKLGDRNLRTALVNAANSVLNPRTHTSPLREWGLALAERHGRMKAKIAVARKLAVILHRMWRNETDYETAAVIR
jgi:transposase